MTRSMLLCLFFATAMLGAAEAPQVAAFKEAMQGQDYQAKRSAIAALNGVSDDSLVYPLLIGAISDRQAEQLAVKALRSRSGLRPAAAKGGNTGYPGYPTNDSASAWSQWNAAREQEIAEKAALEEALQTAEEAKRKAEEVEEEAEDGDQGEGANEDEAELPQEVSDQSDIPQEILGQLDRIFFKDGSILVGYITVRRRDMSGTLTSIHVVHESGGGEEDIDAALISRIEDDIE